MEIGRCDPETTLPPVPGTTFSAMPFPVDPAVIEPGIMSWLFLATLLGALPVAVLAQQRRLALTGPEAVPLDRRTVYASAVITHAFILLGAWLTIRELAASVIPMRVPGPVDYGIAALALAAGLVPLAMTSWVDDHARERAALIAPRTAREFAGFAGVAVSAGIAEEIAYRCVLFALLAHVLGNWWAAGIVGGAAFGIVHMFQGWRSAVVAAALGVIAQVTLGLTGSVLLIIAVHILHDLIAGIVISRRARGASPGGHSLAV